MVEPSAKRFQHRPRALDVRLLAAGEAQKLAALRRRHRAADRAFDEGAASGASVGVTALATDGDVVFYGTLEGYLKAVDADSGEELYSFKTPSGIIGNVNTWEHGGKQYIGVLSGIGGWAGIGLAAGLTEDSAGLGAVGAYKALSSYTNLGGQLTVFALP